MFYYKLSEPCYDKMVEMVNLAMRSFDCLVNRHDDKFHNAEELKKCLNYLYQITEEFKRVWEE